MDFNPFRDNSKFVDLLDSQQNVVFGNVPDCVDIPSSQDTPAKGKEQRVWTPTGDLVLISSWLNTSKDPLVGNEQKSAAFWTMIAAYFSASPKLAGCEKSSLQRGRKLVDKMRMMFSNKPTRSSSTTKTRSSPLNMLGRSFEMIRSGVMLRRLKRRKCEDGSHTGSSQAIGTETGEEDQVTKRPMGVKAEKARGKRTMVEEKDLDEFHSM
ncbi:PREDICTED: glutathione S-transferase T3-like [Brassica oleracea var. oleracea]|uniref:glutathione S-transferase T3-like n=1 Tax=Brassica oleracea var. oleracea TaxID=109376 RepID=UPI0006A7090B|nr:PREDICTED: glutathione S-transferase T3-like [Brassica oleracea var. oleracea]